MKQKVYVISGPAGVGKTTTARKLVKHLERSAYLSGDEISHLPVNGRGKPWLCPDTLKLTWLNMLSLTENLLDARYDVVIDYVSFPSDLQWFAEQLATREVDIIFVVLLVDVHTLVHRDQSRTPEIRMGERCEILLKEFEEALSTERHVLYTHHDTLDQLDEVVSEIIGNPKYIYFAGTDGHREV